MNGIQGTSRVDGGVMRSGSAAVYMALVEDVNITSNSDGTARMHVLSPIAANAMGLNLASFLCCMRISSLSTNGGVTVKYQFSFDGVNWQDAASALISEKTSAGSSEGLHNTETEQTPFLRIVATVRDTVGSAQINAPVSVWGYYKYRV